MKEITLRVTDELAQLVEQWVQHIPNMEVVDMGECMDMSRRDQCFKQAILELKEDRVIRRPRDYAWIMAALEQNVIAEYDCLYSSQAFIDYLELLGIKDLPDRTTLYRAYNLIDGKYPQWSFFDDPDDKEVLRRINVVVRFKSAFYRAKRGNATAFATN